MIWIPEVTISTRNLDQRNFNYSSQWFILIYRSTIKAIFNWLNFNFAKFCIKMNVPITNFENEFRITLQPLDTWSDEQNDSPVYFDFHLRKWEPIWSSINDSDWAKKEIEISQFLSSSEGSPKNSNDWRISSLLEKLSLQSYFKEISLEPEDVYVFKYMYEEARQSFNISKWAIFLAFNVFIQYKNKWEIDNVKAAIASLLLAWKFKEVNYNIPFIDELIDHSKKSVFLNSQNNLITFDDIKNAEIKIAMTLDWNLMQSTIFEISYWLLKHKSDFEVCEDIIISNILEKSYYALPIKFIGNKELISNKNYQVDQYLWKQTIKPNINIKMKQKPRK